MTLLGNFLLGSSGPSFNDLKSIANEYGIELLDTGPANALSFEPSFPYSQTSPNPNRAIHLPVHLKDTGYLGVTEDSPLEPEKIAIFFHELGHLLATPESQAHSNEQEPDESEEEFGKRIVEDETAAWKIGKSLAESRGITLDSFYIEEFLGSYMEHHTPELDIKTTVDTIMSQPTTDTSIEDEYKKWYDEQGGYYQGASLNDTTR